MMREIALSALSVTLASGAIAQDLSPFNTDECRSATGLRWCESKALAQGWKLKYASKSPNSLMDMFWQIELWAREREAMLCEYRDGRGGTQLNGCDSLREIAQ